MTKQRSEIVPLGNTPDSIGHTCAVEFVPSARRPTAIYIVVDGLRIASRGRSLTGQPAWLSLIAGYKVVDDGPDRIEIRFLGERVH